MFISRARSIPIAASPPGYKAAVVFRDMIARCREAGLPAPEFRQSVGQFIQTLRRSTPEVTPEVTPEATPEVTG